MFRLNDRRRLTTLNFFATKMSFILVAISQSLGQEFEFFETHIRPAFHAHCLSCHHQGKKSGGLALDSREGWQVGGDSGPAIQIGAPDSSLLIRVIEHLEPGLEMPAKSPKLSPATIEVFRKWILQGAHDPRDKPEDLDPSQVNAWESLYRERATWWAFTPPKTDPHTQDSTTAAIDRWIRHGLDGAGVSASPTADPGTLLRRLNLVLCGLPPDSDFLDRFRELLGDEFGAQAAWTQAVDTLLDTPEFAEHWARHWMDIVRYAETHGSEDDAYLPFAYRYRDYLVRAFAQDISVQRLIQEHLAGDLIEPRRNPELNLNESLIGLCFYRLVEFNQTPIDVKREEIAVIDSQIDTIGKAFQALTISCARCHDHKFDPISDEDYYSLYGILRSTRTAMRAVDSPELFTANRQELEKIQHEISDRWIRHWIEHLPQWEDEIAQACLWLQERVDNQEIKLGQKWEDVKDLVGTQSSWRKSLARWKIDPKGKELGRWFEVLTNQRSADPELFGKFVLEYRSNQSDWDRLSMNATILFDLENGSIDAWRIDGAGMPDQAVRMPKADAGQPARWSIHGQRKYPMSRLLEPGYQSNLWSDRASGSLRSPDFIIDSDAISLLCRGTDSARARLVIENFQGDSLLFDTVNPTLRSDSMQWVTMRIRPQWKGLRAHIELLTRDAKPYVGIVKDPGVLDRSDGRSSFGLSMVIAHAAGYQPPSTWAFPNVPGDDWQSPVVATIGATKAALQRLAEGTYSRNDVRWVNALIAEDLLGWDRKMPTPLLDAIEQYKQVEAKVPIPTWVPGVIEDHMPVNQPWLGRGDPKQPGEPMPRRYLRVLGSQADSYGKDQSGRLQLAMEITSPTNPLTARVYVNRVWCWLFGQGLVSTVDNFGRMGQSPSHPELLDRLAIDFVNQGWSTKKLIRAILLSETWKRSSQPTSTAIEHDPGNLLFSHWQLQRLGAEAVRDTMLWTAGNLKRPDRGLSTRNYYKSVLEPNKQSPAGPIDGDSRRSIYLEVRRNFPDEFLTAFDFPKPIATTGKRYTSNSPLQSLMLLNDPFVLQQSKLWSARVCSTYADPQDRVTAMYRRLLGRRPSDSELQSSLLLVSQLDAQGTDQDAWDVLAHAMFNLKEVWYVK